MDITLKWDWLKYDIDQETLKSGKCLITNDPSGELTMESQTVDDQFDKDYCKRKITEGCVKLQDVLHKFFTGFKVYNGNAEILMGNDDTLLHEATKWVVTLDNFGSRRKVNAVLMANEMHQYVSLYVLKEWCKMTNPTMGKDYQERFVNEELRLKNIAYRKEVPVRPTVEQAW